MLVELGALANYRASGASKDLERVLWVRLSWVQKVDSQLLRGGYVIDH